MSNFKTLPFFNVTDDTITQNKSRQVPDTKVFTFYPISIDARTEKIFKLKSGLINTECKAKEVEKGRIPNALVGINETCELLTSALNAIAVPKTVTFSNSISEPIKNYTVNLSDLIQQLCLAFSDIFYLEGDHMTFTNEIKYSIGTNKAKPVYTRSYRYPQIHNDEVKS